MAHQEPVRSPADSADSEAERRDGLVATLRWLQQRPGQTWQQRWLASGAESAGNIGFRRLASDQLRGGAAKTTAYEYARFGRGVRLLLGADMIRPSLTWLVTPRFFRAVPTEMARSRDPKGFT